MPAKRQISYDQAEEIRKRYKDAGEPRGMKTKLAIEYKTSNSTIGRILAGETHKVRRTKARKKATKKQLKPEGIILIRIMFDLGIWSNRAIGRQFNLSGKHVGDIGSRKVWKNLP